MIVVNTFDTIKPSIKQIRIQRSPRLTYRMCIERETHLQCTIMLIVWILSRIKTEPVDSLAPCSWKLNEN